MNAARILAEAHGHPVGELRDDYADDYGDAPTIEERVRWFGLRDD